MKEIRRNLHVPQVTIQHSPCLHVVFAVKAIWEARDAFDFRMMVASTDCWRWWWWSWWWSCLRIPSWFSSDWRRRGFDADWYRFRLALKLRLPWKRLRPEGSSWPLCPWPAFQRMASIPLIVRKRSVKKYKVSLVTMKFVVVIMSCLVIVCQVMSRLSRWIGRKCALPQL